MPIEELIRFRSGLKSNPHLRAQVARVAPEPHRVISLVAITGSVVKFANQLGYNFSETEVRRLLDKLALVEEWQDSSTDLPWPQLRRQKSFDFSRLSERRWSY